MDPWILEDFEDFGWISEGFPWIRGSRRICRILVGSGKDFHVSVDFGGFSILHDSGWIWEGFPWILQDLQNFAWIWKGFPWICRFLWILKILVGSEKDFNGSVDF